MEIPRDKINFGKKHGCFPRQTQKNQFSVNWKLLINDRNQTLKEIKRVKVEVISNQSKLCKTVVNAFRLLCSGLKKIKVNFEEYVLLDVCHHNFNIKQQHLAVSCGKGSGLF